MFAPTQKYPINNMVSVALLLIEDVPIGVQQFSPINIRFPFALV